VFKTKVQKKTLHPAWNEFFEIDVPSRTAADFQCRVYDWDFGDKADFLGATAVNLELLDPFKAQEYSLSLDGKSGSVRLRLLFRPDYVTRSRQGSSTFSGTFATPGKVVVGVAGAPIKGVSAVGHGVGKGVGFIRHGFKSSNSKKSGEGMNGSMGSIEPDDVPVANSDSFSAPRRASGLALPEENGAPVTPPGTAIGVSPHSRTKSFGASSMQSTMAGTPGGAPTGTASFTVVSATGYPPSSNVMVHVKQLSTKGAKVIHKTKHIKSATGTVKFDESFKCSCTPEQQFQIQVKNHATFGSDDDLGEALIFVDDSGTGGEKTIKAGSGTVVLKSSFTPAESANGSTDSPKDKSMRRSFLSKRENGRAVSRDATPTPP